MKFEPKISGTQVTDFNIVPLFDTQFISLDDCQDKIVRQETMNYILDNFRFNRGDAGMHDWWAILDFDTIMKISVMENYPEYEKEFIEYFGENWLEHYIRFNH